VHLGRRQPGSVILDHRLHHVVDEVLDRRRRDVGHRDGLHLLSQDGCPIRETFKMDINSYYIPAGFGIRDSGFREAGLNPDLRGPEARRAPSSMILAGRS